MGDPTLLTICFKALYLAVVFITLMNLMLIFQDLVNKKTKFFGGDSVTMIDYMMWPWFERLELFELKQ